MGAKQSATKKTDEVVEVLNTNRRRPNQYEEIDVDDLIDTHNQVMQKGNHPLNSNDGDQNQTPQVETKSDHSATSNGFQDGNTSEVTESTIAAVAPQASNNSPEVNKRFHPYDEISGEVLLSNKNTAAHGKKDVKAKKKDTPKEKLDGKMKKKKEKDADNESELVTYQNMSETGASLHSNDEITNEQLASGQESKQLKKIKKSKNKDNVKVKEKKKKKEKAMKDSNCEVSTDTSVVGSRVSSSPNTSVVGSRVSSSTNSPNLNSRYHPYDEISNEILAFNRAAKFDKAKASQSKKEVTNRSDVTVDTEPVEYLNVAALAIGASSPSTPVNNVRGEDEEEEHKDIYAVPQKKQPKVKSLNYIEVEFNPVTSRNEIKQPSSPTNYCSIVNKDGKLVLMES